MPGPSTVDRRHPPFAPRTMPARDISEWARKVARDVDPDVTITVTMHVGDRYVRLLDAMEACQEEADRNGMTEADLEDILNDPR